MAEVSNLLRLTSLTPSELPSPDTPDVLVFTRGPQLFSKSTMGAGGVPEGERGLRAQ